MGARRIRRAKSLSRKYTELTIAVPQVVAHRATRAALAGPIMSERDRREFQRMVNEKQAAFAQACLEMALPMLRINLQLMTALFRAFFAPFSLTTPSLAAAGAKAHHAVVAVLGKGLAPIHRTAVLNAKRLSKTPLR
jgi:hypothetical protein